MILETDTTKKLKLSNFNLHYSAKIICTNTFLFVHVNIYSFTMNFLQVFLKIWKLDHEEGWAPKNWCFQTVVLEKTFESPLDSKEIKPVNPKCNQPWICIGRTGAEAEAPILWPPDSRSQLIGKDSDAGKDWGQEKRWQRMDDWMASHSMHMSLGKL